MLSTGREAADGLDCLGIPRHDDHNPLVLRCAVAFFKMARRRLLSRRVAYCVLQELRTLAHAIAQKLAGQEGELPNGGKGYSEDQSVWQRF